MSFATRRQAYEILIGAGLLSRSYRELEGCLPSFCRRVVIVSNSRVFELYGSRVAAGLRSSKFRVAHFLIGDGERYKTVRSLESCLRFFALEGLERNDAVLALGGGVVGDLAGLAAALYLRGVAFVQCPTTILAQIDASVGGKTGVNLPNGKNFLGVVKQPNLVIIDPEVLATLQRRELTAGWCEAVKHGAVGSRRLFVATHTFLKDNAGAKLDVYNSGLEEIIESHCAFKARIVAGDQFEEIDRTDRHSRRILNFGHTIGHALETVTEYRRFRHGEAVGYGMIAAGEISNRLGLLDKSGLEFLKEAVRLCGRLPTARDIDGSTVLRMCGRDKKTIGGRIKWVLLERIGRPVLIDGKEISTRLLRESVRAVLAPN